MQPVLRTSVALSLALLFVPFAPRTATAQENGFVVTGAAQYRNALTTLSADDTGPHLITLGGNINLMADDEPTYTGTQPLTIDGQGFTINGNFLNRGLDATGTTAAITIEDLTVEDSDASGGDGGAVATTGPLTVRDAQFNFNSAVEGGALWADGDLVIERSTFEDNEAVYGGAALANGNDITVTDSTFDANTAADDGESGGGALQARVLGVGGGLTILRSTFVDNESDFVGGAVVADDLTVHDSTFLANEAAQAGGAIAASTATATNTTIAHNVADRGGAIGVINGFEGMTVALDHVTLLANRADAHLGVVAENHAYDTFDLTSRATVFDWFSFPTEGCSGVGSATSSGYNRVAGIPAGSPTCGLDASTDLAGPSPDLDIGLGPVRDNGGPTETAFPLAGSTLVDAIPPGECSVTLDQRGVARPFGAGCDIGAVEQVYPPHAFGDVPPWVEDAVAWITSTVNDPPIMTGITPTTFVPNDPITRAQVVRMLYREAGSPGVIDRPAHGFSDVPPWVEDAVRWAKDEEIVSGITPTTFVPNDPITRAQVVRMKYRLAGSPDLAGIPAHPFSDVPAWVAPAVTWAADPDHPLALVTGIGPATFRPNDPITRAQVARMDYRLAITERAWNPEADLPRTLPLVGFDETPSTD